MSSLQGRRVLVTGGGTGIGRAIALGAARAGAAVAVSGRRPEPLAEVAATAARDGHTVHAIPGDVADPASARRLVAAADDTLGGLDGLVNAAGIHGVWPSEQLTDEDFERIVATNLTGAFRVSREAGRRMLARGSGAILHIASLSSFGGFPRRLAYGAAKAGIVRLTQTLAVEWAPRGVRVNALAPGFVRTAITDRLVASGQLDVRQIEARTPMGRRAEPDDMAGPAVFLLSDDAAFVTGHTLVADGGWLAWVGLNDRWGPA
jgi:NAD(P)-dependent dehydrogenase (short-subunit alcohol dehydrogenase family)